MQEENVTANRVTPHLKRRGSAKKMPEAKRHRRKSPTGKTSSTNSDSVPMQWEAQVSRLDPGDPVHANRIQQRRKMITKGKNTSGYDCYLQQVPKHQRVPRSMTTPSTPDPTLDISTKRWQGQVRAWRVALHKYDPPDLVNASMALPNTGISADKHYQTPCKTTMGAAKDMGDSPAISIISSSSCRDLNDEFEETVAARPLLFTGASGWGDDSSDDDDDLL